MIPGDGLGLPETLAELPHGSSALVAVSLADTAAVQAIVRVATRLHRLVVAFEEFGEPRTGGGADALKLLQPAKILVTRYAKGKLGEALQSLGNLNGPLYFKHAPAGGRKPRTSASANSHSSGSRPL